MGTVKAEPSAPLTGPELLDRGWVPIPSEDCPDNRDLKGRNTEALRLGEWPESPVRAKLQERAQIIVRALSLMDNTIEDVRIIHKSRETLEYRRANPLPPIDPLNPPPSPPGPVRPSLGFTFKAVRGCRSIIGMQSADGSLEYYKKPLKGDTPEFQYVLVGDFLYEDETTQ